MSTLNLLGKRPYVGDGSLAGQAPGAHQIGQQTVSIPGRCLAQHISEIQGRLLKVGVGYRPTTLVMNIFFIFFMESLRLVFILFRFPISNTNLTKDFSKISKAEEQCIVNSISLWRPVSCCCIDVQQRHHTCYVQCTVPAIKAVLCIEIN